MKKTHSHIHETQNTGTAAILIASLSLILSESPSGYKTAH